MSTSRKSLALSVFTVASRILGLIRDRFQAVYFGTGPIASAWEIAYMLPNMLRNLLAEGVLSQSFIPVYSDALKESEKKAALAAGTVLVFCSILLSFIVLAGIFSFPFILPVINNYQENSGFLVELAQVLFVFILFTSLTSILMGISQTHQKFFIPAMSPVLLNLIFIAGFWFYMDRSWDSERNAHALAKIVVIGGGIQFLAQLAWVYWIGSGPSFSFDFRHPAIKKIFMLMAPAVVGASMFQLNQLSDVMIASWFIPIETGAVPALRFAHRLIQLPTGIIGVAIATVILPALTKSIRDDDKTESKELGDAIHFCLFLTVPAGIGLYFLGEDIINLIYFGGEWSHQSTIETNKALLFFSLGVPFFSLNKILTSSFYAYQDTKTPVKILVFVVVLNFIMNIVFVHFLQQGGIALSTSLSSLMSVILLIFFLNKKGLSYTSQHYGPFLIKSGFLWTLIIVALFAWNQLPIDSITNQIEIITGFNSGNIHTQSAIRVIPGIVLVALIYFPGAWVLGISEIHTILSLIPFVRQKS